MSWFRRLRRLFVDSTQTWRDSAPEKNDAERRRQRVLQRLKKSTAAGNSCLGILDSRYRVDEVLGQGGFSVVLKAYDQRMGRVVAIKVLSEDRFLKPEDRLRFVNEVRAMAKLHSEYIIPVFDFSENSSDFSLPYYVMPYLEGETLQSRLKSGCLTAIELNYLIVHMVAALTEAHSQGIIHRDIKPSNIWLQIPLASSADIDHRMPFQARLFDFGIARTDHRLLLTGSGNYIGTPDYSSPEQIRGGKAIGPQSDLFSLGIVLYEAACGRTPFEPEDVGPSSRMAAILEKIPRPLYENVGQKIDRTICELIHRMLQKDIEARPKEARELLRPFVQRTVDLNAMAELIRKQDPEVSERVQNVAKPVPPTREDPMQRNQFADTEVTTHGTTRQVRVARRMWWLALLVLTIASLLLLVLLAEALGWIDRLPTRGR